MIASELDDGVLAQTTTLVKSLHLPQGQCRHTNIVRISRAQNPCAGPAPQIVSSTCEQQDGSIWRRTEVRHLKAKYTIEDRYQFQVPLPEQEGNRQTHSFISSSQDSGSSNHSHQKQPNHLPAAIHRMRNKKICLFQKTSINGKDFAKRNTKNIPKNFCKAFGNHMEGLAQSQEWALALKDFRKIEKKSKNKYNNILIQRLLSSPRICLYFKDFLENHAAYWINTSKIADKQVHLEAIQIYHKLFESLAFAEGDPSPSDE